MTNEPPTPDAEGREPTVERGGLWGLFFSTAGLLLPPFGLLLSVFGITQGHRARRAAKASNGLAPGALLSVIVGWIGVLFSVFAIAGYAMFWSEYTTWRDCSAAAHTVATQTNCDNGLRESLAERTGLPPESIPSPSGM
ncbi:DUF4190 domain-containing protein [Marinactinospora rubrisoli]|uniref:DUF4190 domain-containing protein n=1 Tax=Marinactinospora rubrisoli TaxID=2715399 RepID=A0ABW2KP99_9ACTN